MYPKVKRPFKLFCDTWVAKIGFNLTYEIILDDQLIRKFQGQL